MAKKTVTYIIQVWTDYDNTFGIEFMDSVIRSMIKGFNLFRKGYHAQILEPEAKDQKKT